jgi:hypothetical protein
MGRRRRQPMAERPTALEITEAQGMIARFAGFEQLAAAYLFRQPPISANPGLVKSAALATRLGSALVAWEMQAHRTLAAGPDPADLIRVARVQVLITTTTGILTEAAARNGHVDRDLIQQLGPALEANQVAWSRAAKRWGELTSPASRTDPALVAAASEVRAAIAATATNQAGWATLTSSPAASICPLRSRPFISAWSHRSISPTSSVTPQPTIPALPLPPGSSG